MAAENAVLEQKLAALRHVFRDGLGGRMTEIDDAHQEFSMADSDSASRAAVGKIQALSHKLVGTAGTFGFAPVGDAARDLEEVCVDLAGSVQAGDTEAMNRIENLVGALGRVVADALDEVD